MDQTFAIIMNQFPQYSLRDLEYMDHSEFVSLAGKAYWLFNFKMKARQG